MTAAQTHLPWAPSQAQLLSSPGSPALGSCRWRESQKGFETGWCRGGVLGAWSLAAQVPPISPSTRKPWESSVS